MPGRLGSRIIAALLALAALLLVGGCGAGVDGDDQPAMPLVTAGVRTGDLLAYGVITSAGAPVAGATVTLQIATAGSAPTLGETPDRWSSPQVVTDADGRWSLSLDPESIPEAYFPKLRSFLDFDLVFAGGTRVVLASGTVFRRSDPDGWRTEGAGPRDAVLQVNVDLESGDAVKVDSLGETEAPTP